MEKNPARRVEPETPCLCPQCGGTAPFDHHSFTEDSSFASTGDFTRTGWDAGVGLEWMFLPSWSVWVEWDHMGFGDKNETFVFPNGASFAENVKQSVDKVLVGVNYRFGWFRKGKGPVATRY